MLDGFLTDDVRHVDVLRYGLDSPREVTSVDLVVTTADGTRDVTVDLRGRGMNVESLDAMVRRVNALLRASQGS